jgi:site-specific DNA-methyltransferase (adenine-specific)
MAIHYGDCIEGMKSLEPECAQIVICDPPYNIGKDFGNGSDCQEFERYVSWCKQWIHEALRILKPDGTLYIYGFSEILAHIQVRALPDNVKVRWLVWHYTNKNVPSNKFWQRSHESILCVWKGSHIPNFNIDKVREPYTDAFLRNAAGKLRKGTKGRYNNKNETTVYHAHANGALPRDVIKIPALAGGAGKNERVEHPTQKPLDICRKLIKAAAKENGLVVIPFVGSGSEAVVCQELGLPFIGYELNETYVQLARSRLV